MFTIEKYANGRADPSLDTLYHEIATLRAENRLIMKKLPATKRHSATVEKSIVDAHMLIMRAFSGDSTGMRATKEETGMSKRRWQWAVALLRYAGIVKHRSRAWHRGLDWVVTDLDQAIELLEKAGRELSRVGGIETLKSWRRDA